MAVGLALTVQEVERGNIPLEEHDQQLDIVIFPDT